MEAGRELDALVAEKVMGYVLGNDPVFEGKGPKIVSGPHWITENGDEPTWQRENEWPITCPKFSTDIAAAWEVAEQFAYEGQYVSVEALGTGPARAMFGPALTIAMQSWREGSYGDNVAHAICLAALKAKGVDIE